MSQEASTNLIIPDPSEELIASEPWTIETYADGFMDDLFAEIDSILDGGTNLPSQTVQQAYTHLQTVRMLHIVLPDTPLGNIQTVSHYRNNPNAVVVNAPRVSKIVKKVRPKSRHWFSQMLSMGTTLGLAIAGMAWMLNSGLLNRLVSQSLQQALEVPQPQLQPQLPTKAEVEADLANYMLGALAVIDAQAAKHNLKGSNVALTPGLTTNRTALAYVKNDQPTGNANLPPVLAANNTTPAPKHSTSMVERIYIPVYQAPLPMRYVPPAVGGIATNLPPLPSTVSKTAANANKPESNVKSSHNTVTKPSKPADLFAAVRSHLKPVEVKTAPIAVQQAPKPAIPSLPTLLAPPKLPTATAPQPEPAPPKQQVASVSSAPAPSHTLEGLLELGNKSAALFQINGVSRRVDIGESIGASGWTLVDVANGEAIIRRNGEVRSIIAGQKF
jgi:hypothetical protein